MHLLKLYTETWAARGLYLAGAKVICVLLWQHVKLIS